MKVSLFRILGNDLPPRHSPGQTLENLQYQLDNEQEFDDVEKVWVVNRVIDPDMRGKLISALGNRRFLEIDFNPEVYRQQRTFEEKAQYITNNNPARNLCIEQGFLENADIVLPFDGNCFFTPEAWFYARNQIVNNFLSPYFIFPMARCQSYSDLQYPAQIKEMYTCGRLKRHDLTEPQIGFGRDHDLRFNPNIRYSMGPKAELLVKLAIPGPWTMGWVDPQQMAQRGMSIHASRNPIYCGWVWRLPSGNSQAETDNLVRGRDRQAGIQKIVAEADALFL